MNEIIWQEKHHHIIAYNDKYIYFAHGEDVFGWQMLVIFAQLLLIPLVYSTLINFLIKKFAPHVFGEQKGVVTLILSVLLAIVCFVFINRAFILKKVDVPIEQRRNLLTIDRTSQTITEKSKGVITNTYSLSQDTYFETKYIIGAKHNNSYVLRFIRNNEWIILADTPNLGEFSTLITRLEKLGIPLRQSHSP